MIGFQVHSRQEHTARLGIGAQDLLLLTEKPSARLSPRSTGLYHFAVLVPSRLDLATALRQLIETRTPMQGFADHHFSEALYLPDPDGHGIEIYRDRPRESWPPMAVIAQNPNLPLDIDGLMAELSQTAPEWNGLPSGTTIGHIHLQVADIAESDRFYQQQVGFDSVFQVPSAGFVSAGGYHHHVGYNTWGTGGASPPPKEALGLQEFSILLPDPAELDRVIKHLRDAKLSPKASDNGVLIQDPSQITIRLTTDA